MQANYQYAAWYYTPVRFEKMQKQWDFYFSCVEYFSVLQKPPCLMRPSTCLHKRLYSALHNFDTRLVFYTSLAKTTD